MNKPEPWAVETRRCRTCEKETDHQFLYHRNEWVCLTCGTQYLTDEELAKIREEVKDLTTDDIWGGD